MKAHALQVALLLVSASTTGCQWNKSMTRRSDLSAIATPAANESGGTTSAENGLASANLNDSAIQSASKRIDGSVAMTLNGEVPLDQYNSGSRNAANHPTRAKVVPSSSNACASGCSH
ncbi:hypothetical protein [Lacipirellula limnantheis]|uniref:hypothetical protein n=1 Tax=Lacipirellula limnantheis TaxID=2528024 RepID=UPI0011A8FC5D|nr:hypothetical protein [Lacipirellula limnantheis]